MRVSAIELVSPQTVSECLAYLSEIDNARLIAGGTDTVVQMKDGKARPNVWINIKGVKELRYIRQTGDEIHIGPLTTYTDIVQSEMLQGKADALVEACAEVGATQIRNMGTIGGNLATASPAGDSIPPLHLYETKLELQSLIEKRVLPIEEFFYGPRRTALKQNELITNIILKPQRAGEISIFQKLGPRQAQAISIVNVAVKLTMGTEDRQCLSGKIAFGSVAPTIIRAVKAEAMLPLHALTDSYINDIGKMAWKDVAPISDIRASAEYRRDMTSALLERGLYRLMKRWDHR